MTLKQAFKKALNNGWKPKEENNCEIEGIPVRHTAGDILDPEFWKALGKAEGWKSEEGGVKSTLYDGGLVGLKPDQTTRIGSWKHYWHKLIDHLAEGGSIESYFKEL